MFSFSLQHYKIYSFHTTLVKKLQTHFTKNYYQNQQLLPFSKKDQS